MWDLPRPGLEPVSPALAGRFSTTAPPGKPLSWVLSSVSVTLVISICIRSLASLLGFVPYLHIHVPDRHHHMNIVLSIFSCFFWGGLCWVFVAARGLPLVAESGGYSSLRYTGFSLRWLLLLRSTGSRRMGLSGCGLRALEHRLSSCGARALLLRGMWDLPGPGMEPVSPALAGGFLTTAPPGKSLYWAS